MSKTFFSPDDFEFALTCPDVAHAVAQKANAKLEAALGHEVFGRNDGHWSPYGWFTAEGPATHKCHTFNIQPIAQPDTAEGLLRELIEKADNANISDPALIAEACDIALRAKRLLGEADDES